MKTADLADKLQRCCMDLIVGHRRVKVKQGFDASAHDAEIIRVRRSACQAASIARAGYWLKFATLATGVENN